MVLEHFMTDTADHADYVLPATTQLEHWDIHGSYGTNVNELTHQQLTDIGRGPCFYDCVVQVEKLSSAVS